MKKTKKEEYFYFNEEWNSPTDDVQDKPTHHR